jgi:hypothetical protein
MKEDQQIVDDEASCAHDDDDTPNGHRASIPQQPMLTQTIRRALPKQAKIQYHWYQDQKEQQTYKHKQIKEYFQHSPSSPPFFASYIMLSYSYHTHTDTQR